MKKLLTIITALIGISAVFSGCAYGTATITSINNQVTAVSGEDIKIPSVNHQQKKEEQPVENAVIEEIPTKKIIFYGRYEPLFAKAIETAKNQGFDGVYCASVEEVNAQKNIVGIISTGGYIHKPEVHQIWLGNGLKNAPEDTAIYSVIPKETSAELIETALNYPPHDTPVRLTFIGTPASELNFEFEKNVAEGKIYPKAVYNTDKPLAEWIATTLDTFPEGTIDGVVVAKSEDALAFYNALMQSNREDMEIFCGEFNGDVSGKIMEAHYKSPKVFSAYAGMGESTVNSALIDLITAINEGLTLSAKELEATLNVTETSPTIEG